MMVKSIKQHLSDIWTFKELDLTEIVKQHWGWFEKSIAYNKNVYLKT